jgi:hypothetical protein
MVLFALLLISLAFAKYTFAQDNADHPATQPSHAGPTLWMQTSKTPKDLAQAFKARFAAATDDQLQKYESGDDAGDAIAASWELVRRSLLTSQPNPQARNPSLVSPDKTAMANFLDLVDARTSGAPNIWKTAVSSVTENRRPAGEKNAASGIVFRVPPPLQPADTVTFKRQGGQDLVAVDQADQWSIPDHGGDRASAVLTDGFAFLAIYVTSPARPYTVYAIDRKANGTAWSSRVWAADGFTPVSTTGQGGGKMDMEVSGDNLVVFGVAGDAAYIERFDLKTGANLSRFCTKYYDYDK